MQHEDESSGPIMRLFEARAKPGRADELAQKLSTSSIDVVRNKLGNKGYIFGRSLTDDNDMLVFASIWTDLHAVKERFGENWQNSFLPEGYAELIDECSVRHFVLAPGSYLQLAS